MQELHKRYAEGVPRMDPIDDMGITDMRFVAIVNSLESQERKLALNEVFKVRPPALREQACA